MSKRKTSRFRRAAYNQMLRAARELSLGHLEGCLEAILFAASRPMTLRDLARATGARRRDIEAATATLADHYADRGIQLLETNEGFTFLTNPAFGDEVRAVTGKKPVRMSRAQLETLAIIAYRQPITRPEIDEVRGVDSGPVLRTLLERELIRVIGKKEEPGRPLLYGTSDDFLKLLGIKSLGDLPTLREFTELTDESRDTYERKLGVSAPAGSIVFDDEDDEEDEEATEAATQDQGDDRPEEAEAEVGGERVRDEAGAEEDHDEERPEDDQDEEENQGPEDDQDEDDLDLDDDEVYDDLGEDEELDEDDDLDEGEDLDAGLEDEPDPGDDEERKDARPAHSSGSG